MKFFVGTLFLAGSIYAAAGGWSNIIMADDMVLSDMRVFGSEILSPNLDKLTSEGIRMTSVWANVSNTPFRKFKYWVHEGGISGEVAPVIDIMPTLAELTSNVYPAVYSRLVSKYEAEAQIIGVKNPEELDACRKRKAQDEALVLEGSHDNTHSLKYFLSGKDKDDTIKWKFKCSKGAKAEVWDSIKVPSNWELEGFGKYLYGYDTWNHKAEKPEEQDIGTYQYTFFVPQDFKGKNVDIVFEGVMTDTEVMINGQKAGENHQGGFQQFSYPVSKLLKYGEMNVLDVRVSEMSADQSVNAAERKADYWVFGGIYRPVWLDVKPEQAISHIAINASCDGLFNMEVYGSFNKGSEIRFALKKKGKTITKLTCLPIPTQGKRVICKTSVSNPQSWSPESPSIYEVEVQLWEKGLLKHHRNEKFGFRTFEVKAKDGLYLNGKKCLLKGVNRNTFWPESGRSSSKSLSISDVQLIKQMNMNAVRMSHSAPDSHFLDVCDSLGLLVINELTGWQDAYSTEIGKKLVKELVTRDVNHPCVILWANGNEGGFNEELVPEFSRWDIQKRTVIQPWMNFNGINTRHYLSYNYGTADVFSGDDLILPTELLHGSYDGGHGAALEDYWELITKHPLGCGAFLWDFCDSGIKRVDKNGELDAMGDYASDGIVGPYREKEGSFFAVREIWSPVYIKDCWITDRFDGSFDLENRYTFTNLQQCSFRLYLKKIENWSVMDSVCVSVLSPDIAPGQRGFLHPELPSGWKHYDLLQLQVFDKVDRLVTEKTFPITGNTVFAEQLCREIKREKEVLSIDEMATEITVKIGGDILLEWNPEDGKLHSFKKDGKETGLSGGPFLTEGNYSLKETHIEKYSEDSLKVEFLYSGDSVWFQTLWTVYNTGLVKLDYSYDYLKGSKFSTLGISFDYPDSKVKNAILIADGPYRVWKNRLRGVQFGCWEKVYNNTVTGESWIYPEFKGYYSHFYGLKMNAEIPLKIYTSTPGLFLHLFTPDKPTKFHKQLLSDAEFPKGALSFLHGISPVSSRVNGTIDQLGPQSAPNFYQSRRNTKKLGGTLYFDLSE